MLAETESVVLGDLERPRAADGRGAVPEAQHGVKLVAAGSERLLSLQPRRLPSALNSRAAPGASSTMRPTVVARERRGDDPAALCDVEVGL